MSALAFVSSERQHVIWSSSENSQSVSACSQCYIITVDSLLSIHCLVWCLQPGWEVCHARVSPAKCGWHVIKHSSVIYVMTSVLRLFSQDCIRLCSDIEWFLSFTVATHPRWTTFCWTKFHEFIPTCSSLWRHWLVSYRVLLPVSVTLVTMLNIDKL